MIIFWSLMIVFTVPIWLSILGGLLELILVLLISIVSVVIYCVSVVIEAAMDIFGEIFGRVGKL